MIRSFGVRPLGGGQEDLLAPAIDLLCRNLLHRWRGVELEDRKPEAPPMNPMNPTPPPQSDYEAIIGFFNSQQFEVEQVSLKEGSSIDDLIKRRKEADWRKANEDKDEAEKKEMPEEEKTVKDEDVRKHIKCFVVAQPDKEGVIKQRREAMKDMGKAMGAVKGYIEGKTDLSQAQQGASAIAASPRTKPGPPFPSTDMR